MEVYIVRHGLSEGNEKQIFQGRIDFPLADEGIRQAEHLGSFFKQQNYKFDRIVTSPLKRASQTAVIISSHLDNPADLEFEDAFQELDIGKLEGVSGSEIQELFPTYYQRPPSGWLDFAEYGGESWKDLQHRIDSVMNKYAPENELLSEKKLLIVAHGGAMRAIIRNLLGVDSGLMYIRVENCCHFKINFNITRGHLRRYIEYVLSLTAVLVDSEPYKYGIDDDKRLKQVS